MSYTQQKGYSFPRENRFLNINSRYDLTYNWLKDITSKPQALMKPSWDPLSKNSDLSSNWLLGRTGKKTIFEKPKTYNPKVRSLYEKLNEPTYDKNQYHYKRPVKPYIGILPSKPVYRSNINPALMYAQRYGNIYNIKSTIGQNQRYNSTWRNHNGYSFGTSNRFYTKPARVSGNVNRMFDKGFTANSKYQRQPAWRYHSNYQPNSYYNSRNQQWYNKGRYAPYSQCYNNLSNYKNTKAVWR